MTLLSVVIPVYQNSLSLPSTYQVLKCELEKHVNAFDFEFIFVNDGSTDGSWEVLNQVRALDPHRVTLVNLTRNFGQVPALLAGIEFAKGDCIASISADLQDPPSLIPAMVEAWNQGHKVVLAERKSRDDDALVKATSRVFYGLIRALALPSMPTGGFDFFLVDRRLGQIMTQMQEANPFIQGLVLWPGFTPKILPYARRKRAIGRSQWSISKKIKYFIDGFVAYSFAPIRLMSLAGGILCLVGMLLAFAIVLQRILFGTQLQGWSSIMVALLVLSGIQMLMLGILGEYLWRTFDQSRRRPLFLVDRVQSSTTWVPSVEQEAREAAAIGAFAETTR